MYLNTNNIEENKKIGIIYKNSEKHFFLTTIKEELMYGRLYQLKKNKRKYDDEKYEMELINIEKEAKQVLEVVGLRQEYIDKSPFELSEGEKKLLSFAIILMIKPDILIIEDPFCSLDKFNRLRMENLINELKIKGIKIIIEKNVDVDKGKSQKQTFLSKINMKVKLITVVFFSIFVIISKSSINDYYARNIIYIFIIIIFFLFLKIEKMDIKTLIKQFNPIFITSIFVLVFNLFIVRTGNLLYEFKKMFNLINTEFLLNIKIYDEPILNSIELFFQIMVITIISITLVKTSSPIQIMDGITSFVNIKYMNKKIKRISFIVAISLQFIPILLEEVYRIHRIQKERGINKLNIMTISSIIIPIFQNVYYHSKKIYDGMLARHFIIR